MDLEANKSDFILRASQAAVDCKIKIENLELRVLNYTLNETLYNRIQDKLNKESLRYYWQQPSIDIYTISKGTNKHIIENVGVGKIPTSIFFLVQETHRFQGSLTSNGLRFPRVYEDTEQTAACGLDSISLTVANQDVDGLFVPEPDSQYSLNYLKYFIMNDMVENGSTLPPDISPENFISDFHFYHFNLTTSMSNNPSWTKSPVKGGYLRAILNFSDETPCSLTVIAVVIHDMSLQLCQGGKCILEST